MNRLLSVTLLAAVCLPGTAQAWKHIDPSPYAWLAEDMPIPYRVDPLCEESVDPEYCNIMIAESYQAWKDVPCVDYEFEYDGEYLGNQTFELTDPSNHFVFNDPSNDAEVGVLGVTLVQRFGVAFQLFGVTYLHADNGDIAFNDNVDFASYEDIIAGSCINETSIRAVAVHEIGHFLGLGHSCDEEDACNTQVLQNAIMFWSSPNCEDLVLPTEDDIQGITPLYGPSATFSCSHQVTPDLAIGVVPFDLKCVVASRDFLQDVTSAEWTFGDGGTGEGINATHTYEEQGNYTIQVQVHGETDGCGDDGWDTTFRKIGFVRACDVPEVEFEVDHVDGLQYQMLNQTDVSTYGCIQDIVWNVYKGASANGNPIAEMTAKAWEPIFEFPEAGTYTVVGNVAGAAGTGAAKLTFEVKNRRGEGRGCSTVGALGAGSFGMLMGLGLVAIRRRK